MKITRLKKLTSRNALNISGDLYFSSLVTEENVRLLLYRGRNDCTRPVTQKKLRKLAIKLNISKIPISSVDSGLFVRMMLMRRKAPKRMSWNVWRLDILLMYFLRNNARFLIKCKNRV